MPKLTLQRVKKFLSRHANQMSDGSAGASFVEWIQDAMRELEAHYAWKHLRVRDRLTLQKKETGSGINATRGSRVLTLDSGAFPQKYVTEEWELFLSGDSTIPFCLVETHGGEGVTAPGEEWVQADLTGGTYEAVRSRYGLRYPIRAVRYVRLLREDLQARALGLEDFEHYRLTFSETSGQTWVYTTRGDRQIEFWPPPTTDAVEQTVEVGYDRKLELPDDDTDDQDVLDWPEEYEHVLRAALKVQIAAALGSQNVHFDVAAAMREYQRRLGTAKETDNARTPSSLQIGLGRRSRGFADPMVAWAYAKGTE